jgi:hypothetical protein
LARDALLRASYLVYFETVDPGEIDDAVYDR